MKQLDEPTASLRRFRQADRRAWLLAAGIGLALALGTVGRVEQWSDYHHFADGRAVFGAIPNAANVVSNLAFAVVGFIALRRLRAVRNASLSSPSSAAWQLFAAAVLCTAFGSAAYHWSPGDGALVFDRLPIAVACAAVACAFLAERVDPRFGSPASLAVAALAGVGSVGWWWLGASTGQGDLRPYVYMQFMPMVAIALGLWLDVRTRDNAPPAMPARLWWTALVLYGLAKAAESLDAQVLLATVGVVSGHTLKHLLAAAGAAVLLAGAIRNGSRH